MYFYSSTFLVYGLSGYSVCGRNVECQENPEMVMDKIYAREAGIDEQVRREKC